MKQIGQLNEEDLKAYQAGDKSVVMKYMSDSISWRASKEHGERVARAKTNKDTTSAIQDFAKAEKARMEHNAKMKERSTSRPTKDRRTASGDRRKS